MKTNFTKGPWKRTAVLVTNALSHVQTFEISAPEAEGQDSAFWVAQVLDKCDGEANADLIAAAPDLYEALDLFGILYNTPPLITDEAEFRAIFDDAHAKMCAALKKARGEA